VDLAPFLFVYGGLAVLAPAFAFLERRSPAIEGPRTRRARRTDLGYWLVTPLFTGSLARALTFGALALLALACGYGMKGDAFLSRVSERSPLARLPFAVAFVLALVIADLLGYVSHRLRHLWILWRLHTVHHAIVELTALGAARLHPLDEAFDSVVIGVPILLLGFPIEVYGALGPFFILHTLLLHANVPWTFGPLGRVFASPRFHRRHHAKDLPPANYGGVLAVFDVVLGTFDMPAKDPGVYGVAEGDVPETLGGQLLYPIARAFRSLAP
jgi:sterol desaturase/sphingolipid hydroxylase (fatty acid hydroxylase superfamily)